MITEQRERWLAAGSPPVPTLVVDGAPTPSSIRRKPRSCSVWSRRRSSATRGRWRGTSTRSSTRGSNSRGRRRGPCSRAGPGSAGPARAHGRRARRRRGGDGRALAAWFHWPGNPQTRATGDAEIGPYEASVVAQIHGATTCWRSCGGLRAACARRSPSMSDASRRARSGCPRAARRAGAGRAARGAAAALRWALPARRRRPRGRGRRAGRSTSRRCTGSCSPKRLI